MKMTGSFKKKPMMWAGILLFLAGCLTGLAALPQESGSIALLFCDQVNCTEAFINAMNGSLQCAFYNPGNLELLDARLVVDSGHAVEGAVVESGNGLMHNKFCVAGDTVWTGSWNPSQGMGISNNVVLIESKTIAAVYRDEFEELASGVFHGGMPGPGRVLLNGSLVEAYFCPEDDCKGQVMRVLGSANESVHFMTFAFTDDEIGALLREKADSGVLVKGVFDPRKNRYSEFERLKGVSVVRKTHHKMFVVDGQVVVTGSYNPSRNGNERNDENVVIIHDARVAREFLEEFNRVI